MPGLLHVAGPMDGKVQLCRRCLVVMTDNTNVAVPEGAPALSGFPIGKPVYHFGYGWSLREKDDGTETRCTLAPFKPSEVFLGQLLVQTCGRSEREMALLLYVRVCQVEGDRWQPVGPIHLHKVISADVEAKTEPVRSLNGNPFCRPDFHSLADEGYVQWGEKVGELAEPVEITPKGMEALLRHVYRKAVTPAAAAPPAPCGTCDGCGQIAEGSGEPWTAWSTLPPGSDLAVRLGLVKPIPCPACSAPSTCAAPSVPALAAGEPA